MKQGFDFISIYLIFGEEDSLKVKKFDDHRTEINELLGLEGQNLKFLDRFSKSRQLIQTSIIKSSIKLSSIHFPPTWIFFLIT